jgi:adenosylcobinamide-GDP ribazoletransferase
LRQLLAALMATAAMVWSPALARRWLGRLRGRVWWRPHRDRKLEIMRDSAIGTYGVLALILSVGARVAALAAILAVGPTLGLAGTLASQTISRAASHGSQAGCPMRARTAPQHGSAGHPCEAGVLPLVGVVWLSRAGADRRRRPLAGLLALLAAVIGAAW